MTRRTIALISILIISILFGMLFTVGSAQDFGTNWTGQYYNDPNFGGSPVVTRVDAQINFNFGAGAPVTGVGTDNFSIRWTGIQNFAITGTYQFTAAVDDALKAYLDGAVILDIPAAPVSPVGVQVNVTAGSHTIIVEYREFTANALVQFQWGLVGGVTPSVTAGPSPTPGPTNTPTTTPLPPIPAGAITATVIKAAVLNVRDAPSLGGNVVGRILRGQTYAIVGRDPRARWFLLQLSGKQAWAWGYYLYVSGNEFTPPIVSGASTLGLAGQPDYGVVARAYATIKLRAQPNVASPQTGRITWGSFLPVVGRTADGYWWQVVWKGTVGWAYSPFMKIFQGNINNVPIR